MRNQGKWGIKVLFKYKDIYSSQKEEKLKIYMIKKINYCIRLKELKQILMEPDKTYVLKLIKYLGSII